MRRRQTSGHLATSEISFLPVHMSPKHAVAVQQMHQCESACIRSNTV